VGNFIIGWWGTGGLSRFCDWTSSL
jgi:hypothetical protein